MLTDFSFNYYNLLFILPPLLKALFDRYVEIILKKPVVHTGIFSSLSYAIILGTSLSIIDWLLGKPTYLVQSMLLATAYFNLIFDYFHNIITRGIKNTFYISPANDKTGSWTDRNLYNPLGIDGVLFEKIWWFLTANAVYYLLSYVI